MKLKLPEIKKGGLLGVKREVYLWKRSVFELSKKIDIPN
jgi:hypothetical protein